MGFERIDQNELSRNKFNRICTFQNQKSSDEDSVMKIQTVISNENSECPSQELLYDKEAKPTPILTQKQTQRTVSAQSSSISPHISNYDKSRVHTNQQVT